MIEGGPVACGQRRPLESEATRADAQYSGRPRNVDSDLLPRSI